MTPPEKPQTPPDAVDPGVGLECRRCGCHHFYVVWIRHHIRQKRRKVACRHCGKTHLTVERMIDG